MSDPFKKAGDVIFGSKNAEIDQLRNLLDAVGRQVLFRTEDMPEWADYWCKIQIAHGDPICVWRCVYNKNQAPAPDFRPDERQFAWLPIIDAPDAGGEER